MIAFDPGTPKRKRQLKLSLPMLGQAALVTLLAILEITRPPDVNYENSLLPIWVQAQQIKLSFPTVTATGGAPILGYDL